MKNQFQPGDRIRCIDPGVSNCLTLGKAYTVLAYDQGQRGSDMVRVFDDRPAGEVWVYADRFEKVTNNQEVPVPASINRVGQTVVVQDDVDVYTIPRRAYDFDRGDRRFHSFENAVDHADRVASETAVRQCVRVDNSSFEKLYLVQAIGS